jgi:3-dehydroquinate dehydratase
MEHPIMHAANVEINEAAVRQKNDDNRSAAEIEDLIAVIVNNGLNFAGYSVAPNDAIHQVNFSHLEVSRHVLA